jgi:hypothetical protein
MTLEENIAPEEGKSTFSSSSRSVLSSGQDPSIAAYAGYALLVYSAYIIGSILYGTSSNQPIDFVYKLNGILGCFPTILVGYALVFLFFDKASIRSVPKLNALLRHSAAVLGVAYLVAAPMALFMGRNQILLELNRVGIASQQLQERKKQILNSVQGLTSREEFLVALKAFPEIKNLKIDPGEKPEVIINGLESGLNKGIETRLSELGSQQQQRAAPIREKTRSTFVGSLFAGISLLALASRIIPWLDNVLSQVWSIVPKAFGGLSSAFTTPSRRRKRDLTDGLGLYSPNAPELLKSGRTQAPKHNVLKTVSRTFRQLGQSINEMYTSFKRQRESQRESQRIYSKQDQKQGQRQDQRQDTSNVNLETNEDRTLFEVHKEHQPIQSTFQI